MSGFIDIHSHILYGMDDGPKTLAQSVDMLCAAKANGIDHIIATSHAMPHRYPFPFEQYYRCLDELNQQNKSLRIGVTLYKGCELFYSDVALRHLEEKRVPTLAGSRFVLVEFAVDASLHTIQDGLSQIASLGYIPVLAHCERYGVLMKKKQTLIAMREDIPMRLQVNASTIVQKHFFAPSIFKVLDHVDYIATDAHNLTTRGYYLREAYEVIRQRIGEQKAMALLRNPREIFQQ